MTILLTGASGFIAKRFVVYNKDRYQIKTVSLREKRIEALDLSAIDTIIHCAGIAHQTGKVAARMFFDVNTNLTKELALAAKKAGVSNFIFTSTIKVYGEHQTIVLTENSPCEPVNDPYGQSKLEAEMFLKSIEDEYFKVSIIRLPLVYGPNVKGNLDRFLKLADNIMPLPFANIKNRRSMVYIDNLMALINTIIDQKARGVFLATDEKSLSTTELTMAIRKKLNRPMRLFTIHDSLKWLLKTFRTDIYIRLYSSLEMNSEDTFNRLNFKPPYTFEEGIQDMVTHYKNRCKASAS